MVFTYFIRLDYGNGKGGGKPKQLGKNGYYIAACMQPGYLFEVRDWWIVFGEKIFDRDPLAERDSNVAYIVELLDNDSSNDEKGGGEVIS